VVTTPPNSNTNQAQNTQVPQITPLPVVGLNPSPNTGTQIYSNSEYQIYIPSTFYYQTQSLSGGGESLILKPKTPDGNATYIEIQVYSPFSASQSAVENVFLALGYSKNQIFVGNLPATEFKGSIAQDSNYIKEMAVIFTNLNRVYKIQLTYVSKQENKQIEQIFNNIVSGLVPSTGY
jgi:hypothetical protein